ncbi:Microtubule motor, putative [Cryptococcus gattii WM276]|uniref:Microtubule motor, putative n=1 Tax=Cryptococcus gattii serotype B (strain WM276 / ATCC MYA-4071) TaxID=367775 RepID=E6R9S7_CRYGW|nr:Microtubule motor, putative [Cryptococcus gattii WM276]ADV23717.1 Microtubule motor, putative [Cryptococcus gattii WM276]
MSRRPTTSRAGMSRTASSASISMPPPSRIPNRPPSVMSVSQPSHERDARDSRASSPPKRMRKGTGVTMTSRKIEAPGMGINMDGEINIQVVVRCRGRSQQEVDQASPVITTTTGPISKMVTVETTPLPSATLSTFTTASVYGGTHHPTTKTYPFDKVFGPEADQTMVFNEVAEGMLGEVLSGYNCTIFAYGQTGTGKTYTMQGDLELTNLDTPKSTAGIVPRVLHSLFNILESQADTEYSVKCSYVELYNEELRDLLAPEYRGEQSGTGGLKLYEDGKKGTMIQGLEETGVRNLKEALGMLDKGVKRRQTAETKMNTESSRSHTIFSITVHVKESGMQRGGEDMLRIGKFNLVDLAGSEAIGRSGATDKRAREAGMINQSLLTLGRVISALVEKGSHIPYRESKLTRLLQDSLGGRTKTCIVATISPTRSNMEETLSTLDYAIRAKSIRNRPEVNAHLTKTGLLKEYVGDIERLKAELAATREKNGIYIPEDQWREMHEVQVKQKSDYDEAKLKASVIEVALDTKKKEFDEVSVRLLATVDELAQVREAEKQLMEMLDETKIVLDAIQTRLDEETVISQAYMQGEERLDAVAGGLKKVATESVNDVGGLFEKIGRFTISSEFFIHSPLVPARKAKILGSNASAATRFGGELQGLSQNLRNGLSQLQSAHENFGQEIQIEMETYALKGQQATQHDLAALDRSFVAFNDLSLKLASSNEKGQREASDLSKSLLAVKDEVQSSVREWAQGVSDRSKSMVDELLEHQQQHLTAVGSVLDSTASLVAAIITAAQEHLAAESVSALHARDLAVQTSSSEIARLRSQNVLLAKLLSEEKAKTAKLRTELIGNLTSMIESFTDEQDKGWSAVVDKVKMDNEKSVEKMEELDEEARRVWEEGDGRRKLFENQVRSGGETAVLQKGEGQMALRQVREGLKERLECYGQETMGEAEVHVEMMDGFCVKMAKSATSVANKSTARGKKNSEIMEALTKNAKSTHQASQARSSAMADSINSVTSTLLTSRSSSSATFSEAYSATESNLNSIIASTADFLQSGIQEDIPTGITPRKKVWNVQAEWERTGPREAVLASWRKRQEAVGQPESQSGVVRDELS